MRVVICALLALGLGACSYWEVPSPPASGYAPAPIVAPAAAAPLPAANATYGGPPLYGGLAGGITCDGRYSPYANRDRDNDGVECEDSIRAPAYAPATYRAPTYSGGTVNVRGYYRRDGTYVRPHTRRAPRR